MAISSIKFVLHITKNYRFIIYYVTYLNAYYILNINKHISNSFDSKYTIIYSLCILINPFDNIYSEKSNMVITYALCINYKFD